MKIFEKSIAKIIVKIHLKSMKNHQQIGGGYPLNTPRGLLRAIVQERLENLSKIIEKWPQLGANLGSQNFILR